MKIDEIANKLNQEIAIEYQKIWHDDPAMVKYCLKELSGAVQFEDGSFYVFEKPSIETNFCFGYGCYGVSNLEDYQLAKKEVQEARGKDFFIAENMKTFDSIEKILNYEGKVYTTVKYSKVTNKFRGIVTDYKERCGYTIYHKIGELSKLDIQNLKKELERQKVIFRKRLETYWKRYGNSKLKTWTYLVD